MVLALLRSGARVQLSTRGRSMWPAIPSRSQVEVEPCAAAELRAGEVAAFERGGRIIVHRVQQVAKSGVYFAGDSSWSGDGCVPIERVLGRVHMIERRSLRWRLPQRNDAHRLWWLVKRRLGFSSYRK